MDWDEIKEIWVYETLEGWWLIMATLPPEGFSDWVASQDPDIWAIEYNPSMKSDWEHLILFKDPSKYMLFKMVWHDDDFFLDTKDIGPRTVPHLISWWYKGLPFDSEGRPQDRTPKG